jgi:predicted RNA binding protein YcfA (HicA-like mRNA interferase family)
MGGEKIRRLTAKEVERLLSKYGFELVSQKGSHRKWRNQISGRQVIVPIHSVQSLPLGTLRNILINAEVPEFEWKN